MAKNKKTSVRVYNSSNQMIPLQVRVPNTDFYTNEQQIRILPGSSVLLPKDHMMEDQLKNLKSRGMIKVLYDSDNSQKDPAIIT